MGLGPMLGWAGRHVTAQGPPPACWLPASAGQACACPRPYKAWELKAEPAASCATSHFKGPSRSPGEQCQGEARSPGGCLGMPGDVGVGQKAWEPPFTNSLCPLPAA